MANQTLAQRVMAQATGEAAGGKAKASSSKKSGLFCLFGKSKGDKNKKKAGDGLKGPLVVVVFAAIVFFLIYQLYQTRHLKIQSELRQKEMEMMRAALDNSQKANGSDFTYIAHRLRSLEGVVLELAALNAPEGAEGESSPTKAPQQPKEQPKELQKASTAAGSRSTLDEMVELEAQRLIDALSSSSTAPVLVVVDNYSNGSGASVEELPEEEEEEAEEAEEEEEEAEEEEA